MVVERLGRRAGRELLRLHELLARQENGSVVLFERWPHQIQYPTPRLETNHRPTPLSVAV